MRRLISFLLLASAAAAPLSAQDLGSQGWGGARGGRADGSRADQGRPDRGPGDQGRFDRGGNRGAPQGGPNAPAPQAQVRPNPQPDRPAPGQFGQRGAEYRRDGRDEGRREYPNRTGPGADFRRGDGPDNRYGNRPDNRPGNGYAGRPDNRPGDWRDDRRYDRGRQNGYDGRYRDDRYGNNRNDGRGGWNGQWRDDRRYDWQGYRASNRNLFRAPRYYGPRGYEYSRWSRGYRVEPFFYGQSYWINDPWRYRLPPADGYYRWVRYYDDVALIDIRSGLIEDIIYSFFWR